MRMSSTLGAPLGGRNCSIAGNLVSGSLASYVIGPVRSGVGIGRCERCVLSSPLMVRSFLYTVHWSSRRCRLTNDAADADMAHAAVDHLRVARRRAIPPAVVGGAEKRAALDDLVRNRDLRLDGIETRLYRPAPRIARYAARAFSVQHVPGAEPIGGPFPDIPRHIEQPVAVCPEDADRRGPLETVSTEVLPREFALPGVCHLAVLWSEFVTPDKFGAVQSAARREFPLGLGRQGLACRT